MSHRLTVAGLGGPRLIQGFIGSSLLALCCLPAGDALADDGGTNQVLEAIQEELRHVREENRAMREEIDLLQVENSDDWMTEQRAEQIKGLVQDVLADADTRSSLAGNGLMAGWSDHFFLASADGRFLLRLGTLVQNRFIVNHRDSTDESSSAELDPWVWGFETTTARLNFSGHVFGEDVQYRVSLGYGRADPYKFTNNDTTFAARLYEAWTRLRITDEWSVKMGLMKIPFTREFLVYEGRQLAVERSTIDWRMGLGRTMGVELDYIDDTMRGMLSFNSGSGSYFTRQGLDPVPPWAWSVDAAEISVQGRFEFLLAGEWQQFKQFTSPPGQEFGMMFGIAGGGIKAERTSVGGDQDKNDLWAATGDVSMMFGGASLFASFTFASQSNLTPAIDSVNWYGAVVQGSVYLDQKTELYARYEWGGPIEVEQPGEQFPTDPISILMAGINYYIDGQDVKFTIDGGIAFNPISQVMTINQTGWREEPEEHDAEFLIRTQLQLMF